MIPVIMCDPQQLKETAKVFTVSMLRGGDPL